MIIDREKKRVTFELEDKNFHLLDLVQTMGEIDIDEYFDDFIKSVAKKTLRSSLNEINEYDRVRPFENLESFRDIDLIITRWANKKAGSPYEMIVTFLAVCDEKYVASREKMKEYYINNVKTIYISSVLTMEQRFLNIFRMMCTNSRGAYGQIFIYSQETDTVRFSPRYEKKIVELKENFIR